MIFWLVVGIVVGYVFKPQIDRLLYKIVEMFRGRGGRQG